MTAIVDKVRVELLNGRYTATEIAERTGLTVRQVRGGIENIELTYYVDHFRINGKMTYHINRRRLVPMKRGVVRHELGAK